MARSWRFTGNVFTVKYGEMYSFVDTRYVCFVSWSKEGYSSQVTSGDYTGKYAHNLFKKLNGHTDPHTIDKIVWDYLHNFHLACIYPFQEIKPEFCS